MNKSVTKNNYWVAKFGGTSVATYAAMDRCAKVISRYPHVRIVVVSAPAGVTNLLVQLGKTDLTATERTEVLAKIKTIIHAILEPIPKLAPQINSMLSELEKSAVKLSANYSRMLVDEVLAYGERFSATFFTAILNLNGLPATHQDARTIIKTNEHFGKAEPLIDHISQNAADILLQQCKAHVVVMEGFIGSTLQNITTTLGRGGSDYSAALLAEAINAEVVQIWTDVPGIYTVDPGLVPAAKPIDTMCFNEAAELANFGAKVLHPATLYPAIRKNIPVFVGSSMNSEAQGTWVRAKSLDTNTPLLRAISLRRHQSLLTINSLEMLHAHGFLAKVFAILAQHKLSVDLVTTSEVSIALTLNHPGAGANELLTSDILAELQAMGNISLTIDKDLCLIALVGNQLHLTPGISGRVFHVLKPFNIRLICHGASPHNLCFLVSEKDAKAAIQAIHKEFFE